MTIGRGDCDIAFPGDEYLSPRHAEFILRDGALYVRDLGSANRTWVFLEEPHALQDDDVLLIGSQLIQFRRAGGARRRRRRRRTGRGASARSPRRPTSRSLAQLRADGSVRDIFHLAAKRATVDRPRHRRLGLPVRSDHERTTRGDSAPRTAPS